MRTCISPAGEFRVAKHAPHYRVANFRQETHVSDLGGKPDGQQVKNYANFPQGDIRVDQAKVIYEIANAFPFRGVTFIDSGWAVAAAKNPGRMSIKKTQESSTRETLTQHLSPEQVKQALVSLPASIRYSIAAASYDSDELVILAESCCRFVHDSAGNPIGLEYTNDGSGFRPVIADFELFETIANNPYLPDVYKEVMVLRPGVQGNSEIVGDYRKGETHIYEYLRTNSYIPWGHYAANCSEDCIRYTIDTLSYEDMQGLRHLYYQRAYAQTAMNLGVSLPEKRSERYTAIELEKLRKKILSIKNTLENVPNLATLWGWNFGYDFSGTGYRLHASHQMIHQQYAFIGESVPSLSGDILVPFSAGDMVAETVRQYGEENGSDFFSDYLTNLRANTRIDGNSGPDSLIVWQDDHVMLFVPKAQVSQWELQILVIADEDDGPVGNVFEASSAVRDSLDKGLFYAQTALAGLGAKLVTSIEYSKRFALNNRQRLLYSLLPKLPWSMGAFSEAQYRFICGHYPEDFAEACRKSLARARL
ncbi:hypothetical protein [Desulfogranum japonicum]|uniref:hypothetical protein n=1 Tax=Desulfogranum japonicum TaxID=231447 RepID=UPI0004248430|nr:hypothetical protein [Desulfogranum japonicum]